MLALAALLGASSVAAAERRWTGAESGLWSAPGNWDPEGPVQDGDRLLFREGDANRAMINDLTDLKIQLLSFGFEGNGNDYSLSGNSLTLGPKSAGANLVASPDGTATFTIRCPLVFTNGGNISANNGDAGLIDQKTTRLRLLGGISVAGGELEFAVGGYDGGGIGGYNSIIQILGAVSGNGSIRARVLGDYTDTYVEFWGTVHNTFQGTLFVGATNSNIPSNNRGRLRLDRTQGVSSIPAAGRLVIEGGGRVELVSGEQIGNQAEVIVRAGGNLLLNGHSETIGSLAMTNLHADSDASLVDTGGGTLAVELGVTSWVFNESVVPTFRGRLHLGPGSHGFDIHAENRFEGLRIEGTITGPGGFTKSGNAGLVLESSNSFQGTVSLQQGVLEVGHKDALGGIAGGTVIGDGTLLLRNVGIVGEPLIAQGRSTGGDMPGAALNTIGLCSWSGPVTLNTNLVVVGDMTFSGSINGPGGLGCFGGGIVELTGPVANGYTGTTLVRCPVLKLNKPFEVRALAGPLVVGGPTGGPFEARWLNYYQNRGGALTLFANGLVTLSNVTDEFHAVTFNGGRIETDVFGLFTVGNPFTTDSYAITVNAASASAVINGYLNLVGGPANFVVGDGGAEPDLLINATVVGPSPQLIKSGPGTMRLTGANSYSGVTRVDAGVLVAGQNAALGNSTFGTVVAFGATLRVEGIDGMAEPLTLAGHGGSGTGALEITPGGGGTFLGNVSLSGASTLNAAGGLAINGVISGAGPLTKTGAGNLFLAGNANNTYSGDTLVLAGTLYLAKNQNVMAVPGNLIVGPASVSAPAIARWNASGGLNAAATLTVNAQGLADLNNQNQTLPRLNLNDGGELATGSGTLQFSAGGIISAGTLNPASPVTEPCRISGRMAVPIFDVLTFAVSPYIDGAVELSVPAVIAGNGDIVKNGAGELLFTGNNTFNGTAEVAAGDVSINAGALHVGSPTALGGTEGWTFVNNGGSLVLSGGITINNERLFLNSTNGQALQNSTGANTWNGNISLTRDSSISVGRASSLTLAGVVSGNGGLTKNGPGTLALGGTANNTHAGDTLVELGTLLLAKSPFLQAVPRNLVIGNGIDTVVARLMNADQIWAGVTLQGGGILDLNGFNETLGPLTLNGGADVHTGTGTLSLPVDGITVNPGSEGASIISGRLSFGAGPHSIVVNEGPLAPGQVHLDIAAAVSQTAANAALTKAGNGSLRLGGTNSHAGTTTVLGGILQVDGVQPQSLVQLNTGTRLQGRGIVGEIVRNGTASAIAPGDMPATAVLTCNDFSAGAGGSGVFQVDLTGMIAGSGYDQLNVRGTVALAGLSLQANLQFNPAVSNEFTIINNDGSDAIVGTFTGLAEGAPLTIGNNSFVISYAGGSGNDVVLKRVPPPPRPALTIVRMSPSAVRLVWPTNPAGFVLQFSTNLMSSNWGLAAGPPVVVGTNFSVTNTTAPGPRFFRLGK